MPEASKKAKAKYEAKRITKRVSFNVEKDKDIARLLFIKCLDFSAYVKKKIDEDLEKSS